MAKQQQLATQLERIFLQDLPIIPLLIGARWSTYSTKYFHCFPTPKNFYGDPIFTTFPDNILSFTRDLPGRQGRPVRPLVSEPVTGGRSLAPPAGLPSEDRTCAGSPVDSSSTSSRSGSR